MKDLRAMAEQYPDDFEEGYLSSVRPARDLIIRMMRRLRWNDQPVEVSNIRYKIRCQNSKVHHN